MKLPVGILGATGIVGQQYIAQLLNHPWFEINYLAASERSVGKTLAEACDKRWQTAQAHPEALLKMRLHALEDIEVAKQRCRLLFSALPKQAAALYEASYAKAGLALISNASFHRPDPDIPILIPEINAHHLAILKKQQTIRDWKTGGFIVTKPNCSIQSFMIPLDPLHKQFTIQKLHITTLQSISGAGYPGVASHDILDNVIPYIEDEEAKSEQEPLKIWGHIRDNAIICLDNLCISALCTRVPVIHGHMASVAVQFKTQPTLDEVKQLWQTYQSPLAALNLPSSPQKPIFYFDNCDDRPQTRLDRDYAAGMGISVGRLRACNAMHLRFVGLSHNVIRGASGGAVLTAELLLSKNFLG